MYGRIFTPFAIGPFLVIPEGSHAQEEGIPLILGRKGAFGSGEHETTAACLEELYDLGMAAGFSALDLGSGTGILSVAAARLGAGHIVALDIDPTAVASCRDNARLNGMEEQIITMEGELTSLPPVPFDLVMANIYAEIHLALAEEMVRRTVPGGILILSGIPLQDKYDIWQRFSRLGCREISARIGEEYVTYVMRKAA